VDSGTLRELGWRPVVPLDRGLRETVEWYRQNEGWWRPLKSGEFWDFYRRNYRPLQAGAAQGL
jgi:dTDP-glucose 4,6-dehydratase